MSTWDRAYDRLANPTSAHSVGGAMRQRRWAMLEAAFPSIGDMRVLDLGGTTESWVHRPAHPVAVTLLNLIPPSAGAPEWIEQISGDACDPPHEVRSRAWDLVYSNSVIEHVGGHAKRSDFARLVRELAPAHWVQTPYRYFPIEPHWLFPGFQFLPVSWRTSVAMRWPLNKWRTRDRQEALQTVLDVELLSQTEFASYFPDSSIVAERFLGLTKSLIAVGGSAR